MNNAKESNIDNSSINMMAALRNGAFVDELSAIYQEAVAATKELNKKSTITVKLEIIPATKGNSLQVIVEDDITKKLPKPDQGGTLFFTTDEDTLSRTDPYQKELEFRQVAKKPEEAPREIPPKDHQEQQVGS